MDAVVWVANHVELSMQFGRNNKRIRSMDIRIVLVSKYLIWIPRGLIYHRIRSTTDQKIIAYGLVK